MKKYEVKLRPRAAWQLNDIFEYNCSRTSQAVKKAVLSLNIMPQRGTIRYQGKYSVGEYRQLIVESFIIIYTIYEETMTVEVVAIVNGQSLR